MEYVAWGATWFTKAEFIDNHGADTGDWPSSARPAYMQYLGRYYRGERRGEGHIVITTTPGGGWILGQDFSDSWNEWRTDNGLTGLAGCANRMREFEDTAVFKDAAKKPVRMLQRTEAARAAASERLVSLSMLLHDRVGAGKAADWGGYQSGGCAGGCGG